MMTRLLLLVLFVCCVISCNRKERPEDVLSEDKMEKVIWDVVQADEFVQNFVLKDSNKINVTAERNKLYEQVFKLHNTSREQFKKSYDYYVAHPGQVRRIFDSLSSRAHRRVQESYRLDVPQ